MSSWPPTLVDWGTLTPQLRDGDPVCLVHGLVDTETAPVGIPIRPHCHQAVTIAHLDREGVLHRFTEPRPAHCAAAERHPLVGGRMTVGWTSCTCPAANPGPGGHRTWTCTACTELGRGHDVAELHRLTLRNCTDTHLCVHCGSVTGALGVGRTTPCGSSVASST